MEQHRQDGIKAHSRPVVLNMHDCNIAVNGEVTD